MMQTGLIIFIGGGLGSVLRWLVAELMVARFGQAFPWGTLLVNVSGSFAIGLFAALTAPEGRLAVPVQSRLFFMVGICGGYTTFSAFSLQTVNLIQQGQGFRAVMNVLLSVGLCLLGAWLGYMMASAINASKGA